MSDTKDNTRAMEKQREAPDQARIEELAEHFDQTDVGDPAKFEEVEDVMIERRPELAQISVRLPPEDLAALRQQADCAGIGYTTLIRMIIRDHLNSSHGAKRRVSV
jgi:predicted DNA binding CopG/RHH family protein